MQGCAACFCSLGTGRVTSQSPLWIGLRRLSCGLDSLSHIQRNSGTVLALWCYCQHIGSVSTQSKHGQDVCIYYNDVTYAVITIRYFVCV